MNQRDDLIRSLIVGPVFPFSNGLHDSLPLASCGVYTIWKGSEFIYVGIAGRTLDPAIAHTKMKGLRDRLDSHWKGRRSGDQFAVYVFDRFIVPLLTDGQKTQFGRGEALGDALTRDFISANFSYRFVLTASYKEAMAIEDEFAKGRTSAGLPLLNPRKNGIAKIGNVQ